MGDSPLKGPYPDGDTRNITLVQTDSPIEPSRTGPQESDHREEDEASAHSSGDEHTPPAAELGFGSAGSVLAAELDETSPAKRARADAARPLGKA